MLLVPEERGRYKDLLLDPPGSLPFHYSIAPHSNIIQPPNDRPTIPSSLHQKLIPTPPSTCVSPSSPPWPWARPPPMRPPSPSQTTSPSPSARLTTHARGLSRLLSAARLMFLVLLTWTALLVCSSPSHNTQHTSLASFAYPSRCTDVLTIRSAPSTPTSLDNFTAICADIGQRARCCLLPIVSPN